MPKLIQLRHVPDWVHSRLKVRASQQGVSLSDYLVREVTEIAEQPTVDELMERLATREPMSLKEPAAVSVRKTRGSR